MTRASKPRGDNRATSRKVPVRAAVRLNAYAVVERAVDEGVTMGVSRWARKGNAPDGLADEHLASLRDHVEREITNALCDVLDFDP